VSFHLTLISRTRMLLKLMPDQGKPESFRLPTTVRETTPKTASSRGM